MMKTSALLGAALLVTAPPALAQDSQDLRIRAGLGGQIRPKYIGADSHEWAPMVDFTMKRGTEPFEFEAPDDNFDIKIHAKNGLSFGPVANFQSGRKNSDVGAPVGRVKSTIEVGGFVQYYATDSFRLRAEVRQGIGGHKGLVASLGADQVWRDGDRYVFSIGPRVLFSNARYQRSWFGVSDEAALATGLDEFSPDAGLHAVALTSGMQFALGSNFGLFGYARYERLVGDGSKSPIVREYGSKTQASAGIGLNYTFTMKQ